MSEKTKRASFKYVLDTYKESNNQFLIMVEEIVKLRKMNNALNFGIDNAIADLEKPNSDGTIALAELKRQKQYAEGLNTSKYFNMHNPENNKPVEAHDVFSKMRKNKMAGDVHEMHCNKCGTATGHVSQPKIYESAVEEAHSPRNETALTCTICGNQK